MPDPSRSIDAWARKRLASDDEVSTTQHLSMLTSTFRLRHGAIQVGKTELLSRWQVAVTWWTAVSDSLIACSSGWRRMQVIFLEDWRDRACVSCQTNRELRTVRCDAKDRLFSPGPEIAPLDVEPAAAEEVKSRWSNAFAACLSTASIELGRSDRGGPSAAQESPTTCDAPIDRGPSSCATEAVGVDPNPFPSFPFTRLESERERKKTKNIPARSRPSDGTAMPTLPIVSTTSQGRCVYRLNYHARGF